MKIKTSVTLESNVLDAIDRNIGDYKSRSDFLEDAARRRLAQLGKEEKDRRDLEILNRRSDALNREAEDVLNFQVPL